MEIILGNVRCKCVITSEDRKLGFDAIKKLREILRERPDGYHRSERFQKGQWDGYSYFLTPKTRVFPTGMLPWVLQYCKALGIKTEITDKRNNLPEFTDSLVDSFGDITLWDYQKDLVEIVRNNRLKISEDESISFNRGIFDVATNAGKTVIMLGVYFNLKTPKLLFLTRRFALFVQTVEFFEKYVEDVGVIHSATAKHPDKRWRKANYKIGSVTIAMTPTLTRRLNKINVQKDLKAFNMLVADECHYSTADTEKAIINKTDAGLRMFVSGTPFAKVGDKVKKLNLIAMAGPVIGKISNKDLVEKGVSRQIKVHIHLNHVIQKGGFPAIDYASQMENFIHTSKERCRIIHKEVTENPNNIHLITYINEEHGKFMYDYLTSQEGYHIPTVVTGGWDTKGRHNKQKMFMNKQINVFIVSEIIREGLNMPFLDTLIYSGGGSSSIGLKQWFGRGIRIGSLQQNFKVLDFMDIGHKIMPHSKKRVKIYEEEGYIIEKYYDEKEIKKLSN